jgi:4-hydroxy-2-oxoheptanedioate aldolase
MNMRNNVFKRAILAGEPQIGLWAGLCSATVVEVIANAGFDWIVIDTEHAPNELPNVVEQLRALAGWHTTAVVRPTWNDIVLIKRFLDVGAQTLLIPFIQNAEEATRAATSMRYPPHGIRGVAAMHRASSYGFDTDYFARVHEELCLLVQLETRAALAELEAIAEVDGVDGIFIGPSDLAADMGHLGNNRHPDVQAAIADACRRCQRIGKPVGILTPVLEDARKFLDMGITFVAVGSDIGLLRWTSENLLKSFKQDGTKL